MTEGFWTDRTPAAYPAYPTYPAYPATDWPPAPSPPTPVPPPRPAPRLRTWGALVQVFLFADLVVALTLGWAIVRRLSVFNDVLAAQDSLTSVRSWDHTVHQWAVIGLGVGLATGVVFITWFYRARRAAERYNANLLRFGTGWAIGVWITPVLGLWRAPQMVGDVLTALDLPPRTTQPARRAYPLVVAWWTVLLLARVLDLAAPHLNTIANVRRASYLGTAAALLTVAGAVLAMILVGRVTAAADRRRDAVVQEWLATRF